MAEAMVFDAIRTPRGRSKSSGALYDIKPVNARVLDAIAHRHACREAGRRQLLPLARTGNGCAGAVKDSRTHFGWRYGLNLHFALEYRQAEPIAMT
jgi:hypothetical protein